MDEITFRGEWWQPSDDDTAAGVLTYSPSHGGKLELFGSITDKNHWDIGESKKIETIHGEVIEGKEITLKNCYARFAGAAIGSVNIHRETIRTEEIFVGGHFDEVKFEKVDVDFPNLAPWTAQSPIETYYEDSDSMQNPITEINPIDNVTAQLDDCDIELRSTPRLKNNQSRGMEYSHDVTLRINPDGYMPFGKYRKYIKKLQQYLTLATKQATHPREIVGRVERDGKWPDHKTTVYYHLPRFSELRTVDIPSQLNFNLDDITFEESINKWIKHSSSVPTFHELYFNTRYDSDMNIKFLFLALCSAMESLFEHQYPDLRYMDKESYSQLRQDILEHIPDDAPAKNRIKSLLGSIGNQYSMKEKLEVVTEDHREVLCEMMDLEDTLKDIRDTRHNLAHGLGGSLQRAKTNSDDLSHLYFKLRIIVEIILFDIIGLKSEKITTIIERNYNTSIME